MVGWIALVSWWRISFCACYITICLANIHNPKLLENKDLRKLLWSTVQSTSSICLPENSTWKIHENPSSVDCFPRFHRGFAYHFSNLLETFKTTTHLFPYCGESKPIMPCFGGWTSINPSYFGVKTHPAGPAGRLVQWCAHLRPPRSWCGPGEKGIQ